MPDLTVEYVQVCVTNVISEEVASSSGRGTYRVTVSLDELVDSCDCDGYRYRGKCRHVTELRKKLCGWDSQHSEETQTPQQEMMAVCPKCGGETTTIRVGV